MVKAESAMVYSSAAALRIVAKFKEESWRCPHEGPRCMPAIAAKQDLVPPVVHRTAYGFPVLCQLSGATQLESPCSPSLYFLCGS